MSIHPTALVDPRAEIDLSADIGPFVVIEGPVVVGAATRVGAHAVLGGRTTIGRDNVIHAGAVIGGDPQDLSYTGGETHLRIGDRNVFREHSEVHRGSGPEAGTWIGDDNYLMSQSHVGHDCRLGDHVILASGAKLGGHVEVGDRAFVGGNTVVHQFVRVGRLAMLRGLARASRDVPPFAVMDETHTIRGLNRVGLRRAGYDAAAVRALQRAFVRLFRTRMNLRSAMAEIEAGALTDEVRELLDFIRASRRGVCMGPKRESGEGSDGS
jgi:UDP-N-acetylglucosamine acyltransferase